MNEIDLEERLHDYYTDFTPRDSTRAISGVGRVVENARLRQPVAGKWLGKRLLRGMGAAAAAVAIVVALAVALMPIWRGNAAGPGASMSANPVPSSLDSPVATEAPTNVPTQLVPDQFVSLYGVAKNGYVWAIHGTLLEISRDHGRTWHGTPLPKGPGRWDNVQILDETHFWATQAPEVAKGSAAMSLYRTADGGRTWTLGFTRSFTVDGFVPEWMSVVDANVGFVVLTPFDNKLGSLSSTIMRTLDGGATWSAAKTKAVLEEGAYGLDASTLWMSPHSGPIFQVSRDGGATWSAVDLPGAGTTRVALGGVLCVTFFSAAEGYMAIPGHYYRTSDGGKTWSHIANRPGTAGAGGLIFLDATHWIEIGSTPYIWESTSDAGKTWTDFARLDYTNQVVTYWSMYDEQNGVGTGTDYSAGPDGNYETPLFVTWDAARTWHQAVFTNQ